MSFPWQNDSAELEAMEELPGGILDTTPSPTPSPASSRAFSPALSPSPGPQLDVRPRTDVQAPRLPPLMPAHLSTSTNEQTGRSGRPIAGRPLKFPSSGAPRSNLAAGMQAGPSGPLKPPASRLTVQPGQIQESTPFNMPARTLSAVALGKQPCRSSPDVNEAQDNAYQQASGSSHPFPSSQKRTSNLATTVTQTDSDNEAEAANASAAHATQNEGYESDNSDVSYVEVPIGTPEASGSMPVAEAEPVAVPTAQYQPVGQSGRPKTEVASKSQPVGLSEVARGKQRCKSPDIPPFEGQQASQSATRERGSASTMAGASPPKAATRPIYKSKWASPSGYTSKWAKAPAARYTSKWATAQPEDVPDAAGQPGWQEEADAFHEDIEEEVDVFDEDIAEDFDAFDEDVEEEDIDGGEMPIDEENIDEDEDEDDGMSVDEEEPPQDDDDDAMPVDEEERAEEAEDVDMLVDDPEDEDVDMQVDPEPASAAPQYSPVPPQPSNFHYSFNTPPAPRQQEAPVPDPRPFFEYFAFHPHPPFFTESRREERYPRPWQSKPAPTWTQRPRSYKYGQQPYTRCASYVPYNPRQRPFQPYRFTPSRSYTQSPPHPLSTYFYRFKNQFSTPSYTFAHSEYHEPQVCSDQLRFEDNYYAREEELSQTQDYSDENQTRQSFAQAFVAMIRRLLKRREEKEIDVQESNERCVKYAEHEDRRFEEDTEENDQEEQEEDENEDDEDDQLRVQIIGAYKPYSKQAHHASGARQDRQHEGMVENLAKKTSQLIQENKWIALPAIGLAVYHIAPTLVKLLTSI